MKFLRLLSSLTAMASFVLVAIVLLWSDRAGALPVVGRRVVTRLGREAESTLGFDLLDRSDIPFAFDQLGHMSLWFVGMVLFGWVGRRFVPLWLTAILVGGASVVSEAGQGWASSSRDVDPADAVANLTGVALGLVALTVFLSVRLVVARVEGDGRWTSR